MAEAVRIEIHTDEAGHVRFSIEKNGVKRSACFGDGVSGYSTVDSLNAGGGGGMGISRQVRSLAAEVRAELYRGASILDVDAAEREAHRG